VNTHTNILDSIRQDRVRPAVRYAHRDTVQYAYWLENRIAGHTALGEVDTMPTLVTQRALATMDFPAELQRGSHPAFAMWVEQMRKSQGWIAEIGKMDALRAKIKQIDASNVRAAA